MKIWYRYALGFYSAVKTNVIMKFPVKWMELQNIVRRAAQAQRDKCCMLPFTCGPSSTSSDLSIFTYQKSNKGPQRGGQAEFKRRE